MMKLNEIEILEDISSKIKKLLNAKGSYSKDDTLPWLNKNWELDIERMITNIKNDFPIFVGTKIERYFEWRDDRIKNLHSIINHLTFKIQASQADVLTRDIIISDQAQALEFANKRDDIILERLLSTIHGSIDVDSKNLEVFIYQTWNRDVIINMKLDLKIPFNDDDTARIKELTKCQ